MSTSSENPPRRLPLLVADRPLAPILDAPPALYDVSFLDDGAVAGKPVLVGWGMTQVDRATIARLPDLECIVLLGAGYGGIDLAAARDAGVAVSYAGPVNATDVADHALALLLALQRKVLAADRWIREDRWFDRLFPLGRSMADERVGIVGLGPIGEALATRLEPFGCEIAWWGPRPKPEQRWERHASLRDLAEWATVLAVAARGDPSTRRLIDAATIDALGPEGLLVNVSRGLVIDEPAMIAALHAGRLGGAALDVFETEPFAASRYADVPNLIMTPHIAGATRRAVAAARDVTLDSIARFFAGKPLDNRLA